MFKNLYASGQSIELFLRNWIYQSPLYPTWLEMIIVERRGPLTSLRKHGEL